MLGKDVLNLGEVAAIGGDPAVVEIPDDAGSGGAEETGKDVPDVDHAVGKLVAAVVVGVENIPEGRGDGAFVAIAGDRSGGLFDIDDHATEGIGIDIVGDVADHA